MTNNINRCPSSFGKKAVLAFVFSLLPLAASAQVLTTGPSSQNFGQVAANSGPAASNTLTFAFTGTATPLFSLNYGLDFSIGSTKCSGSGTITCAVTVSFLPHVPGSRQDALLIENGARTVIGTTLLSGLGLGSEAALFPGTITTLAGIGRWAYAGDGGLATSASLRNPQGVAMDSLGNLYIADSMNQVVREVAAATGKISTVAGNGAAGYSGDGGLATAAKLNSPSAVAVDGAGNLYIADQGNNVIRKVNAFTKQISTVAGGGAGRSGPDGLGDGGPATSAILNGPSDIAVDGSGSLYIADSFNGLIRKVNAQTGIITVIAGGGAGAGSDGIGDGGPATAARLNVPGGVTLDAAGNVFVADTNNSMVRRVDATTGVITAIAGTGRSGYSGDAGKAVNAQLGSPSNVRTDAAGNLYIADQGFSVVRMVNGATGVITTIAGTGTSRYAGDGALATSANLASPSGLALDASGNLYIADFANNAVRKVMVNGLAIASPTTLVGQSSSVQPLSLVNLGNQPLTLSTISVSANFLQEPYGTFDCATGSVLAAAGTCTIGIEFLPSKAGALTGILMVKSNSSSSSTATINAALSGTGASGAVPQIAFNSSTLAFGNQTVGSSSAAQTITISNTGAAPLNISSFQVTGANTTDFNMSSKCPYVIAAGSNCSLSVVFAPSAVGARMASLIVIDNAGTSNQIVSMTGTGTGTPQIALSPASLKFGSASIGGSGATKSITLSNTGSGPLTISTIALSGTNSADFKQSTTCGATVAAGATCTFSLTFSPGVQGVRTAALTLTTNVAGSASTVSLSGTGLAKGSPAVWRSSSGAWYIQGSTGVRTAQWGQAGDVPVPADYDGDGKIDFAVFRPSSGAWYIIPTTTGQPMLRQWGASGDIPVPADYDGDGKADVAVWRPSEGNWYVILSGNSAPYAKQWGAKGDIPVAGDYDGDGKADIAIWRPSEGTWYILPSGNTAPYAKQLGANGDVPVPGDYDGDGKTDLAVWRPSNGNWSIVPSSTSAPYTVGWGANGDVPVAGDFDGDGKMDCVVWRPSSGLWYVINSGSGSTSAIPFGVSTDTPLKVSPR